MSVAAKSPQLRRSETYTRIIRLGLPILVGQLGMIAVGFADTKMVGLYSTEALASASFVNNLFNVAVFACIGFAYGLTPLTGALFGRNERHGIGAILFDGIIANILFALAVSAVMGIIYLNLDSLDQPPELMPLIRSYYLIYLAGIIPLGIFNAMAQWSYAVNRTALPMWIILFSNAVNILGNWMFIYGHWGAPELGLTGAGLSTLTARLLCPLMLGAALFLLPIYHPYRSGLLSGRLRSTTLRRIFATSMPVSLQMIFESGAFTIGAVMSGWLGAIPLAAYQIVVTTGTLGFCVYYSVAAAVAVLVSNAAGSSDSRRMRHIAACGYHIILLLATCASATFIFAGPTVIRQFTHDPAVIATAVSLIVPLVIYQYGDATQITYANALRGTSDVMPMMWIALICYVIIGIPATYGLAFTAGLGIYGIILSFSVSLFMAAALFTWFFYRTTRRIQKNRSELGTM